MVMLLALAISLTSRVEAQTDQSLRAPGQLDVTSQGHDSNSFPDRPPLIQQKQNNVVLDDRGLLPPYLARAEQFRNESNQFIDTRPKTFDAWWMKLVKRPIGLKRNQLSISLNDVVTQSLIHAPQIRIAAAEPKIRETNVVEQASSFDWTAFWETKYDSLNDPIGNALTTGNNESRFRQQEWNSRSGIRRQNPIGGELEVSQRLGYLDNNSRFLVPHRIKGVRDWS